MKDKTPRYHFKFGQQVSCRRRNVSICNHRFCVWPMDLLSSVIRVKEVRLCDSRSLISRSTCSEILLILLYTHLMFDEPHELLEQLLWKNKHRQHLTNIDVNILHEAAFLQDGGTWGIQISRSTTCKGSTSSCWRQTLQMLRRSTVSFVTPAVGHQSSKNGLKLCSCTSYLCPKLLLRWSDF